MQRIFRSIYHKNTGNIIVVLLGHDENLAPASEGEGNSLTPIVDLVAYLIKIVL